MNAFRPFLLAVLALAGLTAAAAVIDENSIGTGDGALPKGWGFHGHPGYKPNPSVEIVDGPDGLKALHVFDVKGNMGSALTTRGCAARVGDAIVVSGRAKGRGRVTVCHFRWTTDGKWNQSSLEQGIRLSEKDWTPFRQEIRVANGTIGKTGSVVPVLCLKKGADVSFADVKVCRIRLQKPDTGRTERMRTLVQDDFEKPRPEHPKALEIVTGEFAPGIATPVKMARIVATASPLSLSLGTDLTFPAETNGFFKEGLRVYDLAGGKVAASVRTARGRFAVVVAETNGGYRCVCRDPKRDCGSLNLPAGCLPADFTLAVDDEGGFTFAATSLAGTIRRSVSGDSEVFSGRAQQTFEASFVLAPAPRPYVVDELFAAWERPEKVRPIPFKVVPEATFDPKEKGWPCVFSEDFDGENLDMKKWYFPAWQLPTKDLVKLDGKGHLAVEARIDEKDPNRVRTGGVWTRPAFRYGYFEARLKFTKAPAWWAAYWMYGISDNNAFLDGLEIDIFEDFETRRGQKVLSHNMHVIHPGPGGTLKSWSRHSGIPGELDEWHVIGCKWTPFEISLYMNGKLIVPSNPVTFDAFRTAACAAPLHACLSGQSTRRQAKPLDPASFPEFFEVDWFRAYAWPDAEMGPEVAFTAGARTDVIRLGEEIPFSVAAKASDAPLTAVYLFDNGYLMDFKTEPPFDFRVPFTEGHYATTQYMVPGVSGVRPPLDGHIHAFRAFVTDAKGRIRVSEPAIKMTEGLYGLKARGRDDRFAPRSGDAFHTDIDCAKDGPRYVGIRYVASEHHLIDDSLIILVDGVERSRLDLPPTEQPPKPIGATIDLTRGRHRITFLPIGLFNVYGIETHD